MKRILFAVLTLVSLSVYAQDNTIINDKNAQVRSVIGFNAISVSGAVDVYLSQGNTEAVAVSASEDKFRDKIKTEVVNNVLKISYEGDKFNFSTTNKKLRVYVSFTTLKSLNASGASEFKINGTIAVNTLDVHLTGASDMNGNVKINDLTIDIHGASDVKLTGTVKNINIDAQGASDVKGYDLTADACTVKATGASDINITVNKEISAQASGASSVFYKGDAVMKEVRSSGASSIGKKG